MGGHGDGLVVMQAIRDIERHNNSLSVLGFLNDTCAVGDAISGLPVLGKLEDWSKLEKDVFFIPALHKVKQMMQRKKRIEELSVPIDRWATIVHPTAVVADDVPLGAGSYIGSHVTIQPGAMLGMFSSVRSGANIGHDVEVGDYCYVGPNATLSGCSRLKQAAHLGPNAVVVDGLVVGEFAVIGAGAMVGKGVDALTICIGNPARVVGMLKH